MKNSEIKALTVEELKRRSTLKNQSSEVEFAHAITLLRIQ